MWRNGLVVIGVLLGGTVVLAQGTGLGLPDEVADYFTWERANPQKDLEESAHPLVKDIYIDELAAQSALEASFPYGEGSTLIKERMNPETLQVTTFYAMRKVAGFDPENGDWQYAVFEREDTGAFGGGWLSAENAGMCVGCHVMAEATDYTFLSYLGE